MKRNAPPPSTAIVPTRADQLMVRADMTPEEAQRIRQYWEASQAENTRRAYDADWAHFEDWCREHRLQALPAFATTVADYLAQHAGKLAHSTLQRRLAGIAWKHGVAGLPSPTGTEPVRKMIAGIARTEGALKKGKAAIDRDLLLAMVRTLDASPEGLRDRSLLLTGFFGAFRRSEFVKLRVEQLAFGPNYILCHLGTTKTDQTGERDEKVALASNDTEPDLCPVAAMRAWMDAARIGTGFVYRGYAQDRKTLRSGHLDAKAVNRLVKECVAKVGLSPKHYGAHSLRAGFVTQAFREKADLGEIQQVTRHRNLDTLMSYRREADPLHGSAALKVQGRAASPAEAALARLLDGVRQVLKEGKSGVVSAGSLAQLEQALEKYSQLR